MPGRTLLVIDDNADWCRITSRYFTQEQYKVHTAATCAEGIALAEEVRPDCILLDYHLKDGKAVKVSSHIRKSKNLIKTLLIIVSGDATLRETVYDECQADYFILKGAAYMCGTIHAILRSRERRMLWDRGIVEKGDLHLDMTSFQVFRNSRPVARLSPEQFRLFSLLVENSPAFVSKTDISKYVLEAAEDSDKSDAIRGLAQRLRVNLGTQLGRRIKVKAAAGWIYVQPRERTPR